MEKREDLKNQVTNCEEKIDLILDLLRNKLSSTNLNVSQSEVTNGGNKILKENSNVQTLAPERILSPSNVKPSDISNDVFKSDKNSSILNEKSRTPHYPKSNITRAHVSDDKVLWSIKWPEYRPIEYNSKLVLNNPTADINLLSYPPFVRPELDFNNVDEAYKVDRCSCLGKYNIVNGLPINPIGRTGIIGRGSLNYWGPNHAVEAIITRLLLKI